MPVRLQPKVQKMLWLFLRDRPSGKHTSDLPFRVRPGRLEELPPEVQRTLLEHQAREAHKAADTGEKQDSNTKIDVEEGELSLLAARAMVCRLRGSVEFVGGRLQQAVECYKRSIELLEFPDTDLLLAWAYEERRQPDLALVAYGRCAAVAADEETEVEAQKAAARLRAGMLLGGWFVGSWKIFGSLAFFAIAGLIAVATGGGVQMIPGTLIFAGLAALYGWKKFRRPSDGAIAPDPSLST